jgi:TrmH family RNA methyltransferase
MLSRGDEKLIRALQRRKHREENGLFLAEGVRVVEELLTTPIDLYLAVVSTSLEDTPRGRELATQLSNRVRTERISRDALASLAATDTPQGVVVAANIPRTTPDVVEFEARSICLILDAVQDPGNFGTLVRSADAFRAAGVVALPGTVDPWNPKSVRSAAGSSFRVPILQMDLAAASAWLRNLDFRFFAADADGKPVDVVAPPPRVALLVGNEGAGIGAEARAEADEMIAVPIPGPAESLNVGVAAGILLYLLTREP